MALQSRSKVAVGSAQWILEERNGAEQFIHEETEEFGFAVRNEMEWLNEHMAEVFSRDQFDVVEAFKTPGKLRGKTPWTARKANTLEARAPLTDIFAPTNSLTTSPRVPKSARPIARFQVAEDKDVECEAIPTSMRFSDGRGKENADSGYHDMTDEGSQPESPRRLMPEIPTSKSLDVEDPPSRSAEPPKEIQIHHGETEIVLSTDQLNNEKINDQDLSFQSENATKDIEHKHHTAERSLDPPVKSSPEPLVNVAKETADVRQTVENSKLEERQRSQSPEIEREQELLQPEMSPLDEPSPARTTLRKKSSLTFASLPAREPLTTKKSVGPSMIQTSQMGPPKGPGGFADTYFGLSTGTAATNQAHRSQDDDPVAENTLYRDTMQTHRDATVVESNELEAKAAEAELKAQSRASTLRLQERLAMLGKSNPSRLSRSVPQTVIITQTTVRDSPERSRTDEGNDSNSIDDADDWIGPINMSQPSKDTIMGAIKSPAVHGRVLAAQSDSSHDLISKGETTPQIGVPKVAHQNAPIASETFEPPSTESMIPSYPKLDFGRHVTSNLQSSPAPKKHVEGPLSASKAKLQSMLKSARGIFSGTANVNNHSAKDLPASASQFLPASPSKLPRVLQVENESHNELAQLKQALHIPINNASADSQRSENSTKEPRRSSQRIARKKAETEVDFADLSLKKRGEQTSLRQPKDEAPPAPPSIDIEQHVPGQSQQGLGDSATAKPPDLSSPVKSQQRVSQLQKPGEIRRLLRPTKDAPKARPAPVAIKLASQKIGQIAPANATLGMALHESLAQPAAARPALTKKMSASSLTTTSSSQSFKTSTSSLANRPKALEAAARKREQDEREALRKAEQKREMERRRAAKAEEDRRAIEEQRAVEQQRALEAKHAAQKQTAEQRKADVIKRNDQRKDATSSRVRGLDDMMNSSMVERPQSQLNYAKAEPVIAPVPKNTLVYDNARLPVPHVNPAKPPKRNLDYDDDYNDFHAVQQVTASRTTTVEGHPAQKRRRTSEAEVAEPPPRPTMAPPIRPSNIHKTLHNKFAQGFLNTATVAQSAPLMLKTAVTAQHASQHPKTPHDLAKQSHAKITFADPQTTTGSSTSKHQQTMLHSKTPGTAHKSSPQYPNGDSIDLPEIATDSEESDDEDGQFQPPAWANSPALRELLAQQQLVDPMQVFGPIAPLMMEEVFKGNKERQAKFRARTSSANWNGPDRLTEEERRQDHAAREKLQKNGGWVYGAFS